MSHIFKYILKVNKYYPFLFILSALGQHNDGFVRCPEEALTWQHRKYLIVQEILQNQPDVVCLQVFI